MFAVSAFVVLFVALLIFLLVMCHRRVTVKASILKVLNIEIDLSDPRRSEGSTLQPRPDDFLGVEPEATRLGIRQAPTPGAPAIASSPPADTPGSG